MTNDVGLDAVIGERVHQLMWRQRVSVTTLARALGIAQPTLSRKLRGERPWYAGEIAGAADYLAVPVGDLFGTPEVGVKSRWTSPLRALAAVA